MVKSNVRDRAIIDIGVDEGSAVVYDSPAVADRPHDQNS